MLSVAVPQPSLSVEARSADLKCEQLTSLQAESCEAALRETEPMAMGRI